MLDQLNMSGLDRVEVAIKRLQTFEPPEGYYLAFSGGKDSVVIKTLADIAGVKYDAHYNVTSVDPPELLQFIRKYHPDVKWEFPTYKQAYLRAFDRMLKELRKDDRTTSWKTAQDVMEWWLNQR